MDGLIAAFLLLGAAWAGFYFRWLPFELLPAFRFLVLRIALPAYVFTSFVRADPSAIWNAPIFFTFAIASVLLYLVYGLWGRFMRWGVGGSMLLGYGAVASNSLLLGVPIFSLTFAEAINPVVAQIILFENIFLVPGFMLVTNLSGGVLQALLRNQFLWAVGLALVIGILQLPVPAFVLDATELMGRAAAPVAILTVGGILAKTKPGRINVPVIAASAGKLLILPLLGLVIGRYLGVPPMALSILVLFMALPNAAIFPIFGEEVERSEFSNAVFVLSYSLAFFTLSAWLWALSSA